MENKEKNETQSRRDFFKEAARRALPILGAVALMSNPLVVKAIENESNDCSGSCYNSCLGTCNTECVTTCRGVCYHSCNTTCTGSCKDTCTGHCKHTCWSVCSDNCKKGMYN